MQISYPFVIDGRGRVAEATEEQHIGQLIEQVLFTMPGERVNRPTFGSGLMQLVFNPNSEELATAVEYLVQGALQQWLGDLIEVEGLLVEHEEATLVVTVQYLLRRTQERQVARFQRGEQP
jgi:phage baseplate assembly protein W